MRVRDLTRGGALAGIDHALGRLEMAAQERSIAVGISSALPVSIDHIAKWAKAAEAAACS